MKTKPSFFNKKYWSNNKFAWMYAGFILILAVLFAIILKVLGIYEGMALRGVHIFFILLGFILLMWDFRRNSGRHLTYVQAFLMLFRAGLYFCLLFLPILLVFIDAYPNELALVRENETFAANYPVIQIVFSTYLVTLPTVALAAMTVAYMANFGKKKTG